MRTRRLGTQGLAVSELGLGRMGMSDFYAGRDEAESIATLERTFELGITFFDTADMYGPFTNEELLGRFLKGKRDRVVLATKFAIMRDADGTWRGVSGRPEYVKQACDGSLKRPWKTTQARRPFSSRQRTFAGSTRCCQRARPKGCAIPDTRWRC